ncbi:substrate-binding domain-containing protein [Leptolyngbya cf. ectocarpi LEGE 11479]|uniref:Substrate-binding domain-containing protein n=1 Tax=Leptolyngbya cf. ectocarpi LEGE 11479 TaxID=1828722 RepID=A0A928WYT7_LEPEC|nr:substrate-binding domain-containing protein [Leptolyngbya ectocarpi]MBE9065955.1 substrate-binding domain-containing protein [Leptolyngbya cf. ectocarpi LEGE 11479]
MPLILSGRYLTQRLLGQGGFGAAYYACDRYTPTLRPCVVKLFQPSSQLSSQQLQIAQQLFAREADVLERLGNQHPQIPDLYAYFPIVVKSPAGKDEEYFYLVQEFIDGEDLEQILDRRGTLPEGAVKAILASILKVLAFVHKNGAIHRDIKPSNIMKTVDNQLFLLDFGAVKQVTGAASTKSTGIYTTGYAPPEQVTGGQVFPASDLYSLAVTCIVLLTGKATADLFDSYSNRWRWQNHVSLHDQTLATVLDKLLNASPQDRYASAEDTLKALMGDPKAISAPPASVPPPPIPVAAPPATARPSTPMPVAATPPQPPAKSVAQPPSAQTSRPPNTQRFLRPWMLGLVLLAALAGGGWWWLKQKGGLGLRVPQLSTITPATNFSDVDVTPGQFTYGGSTTWAPIRGIIDPQLQQAIPGLQLTYRAPTNQAPGSSTGIQMLLNGELDFAQTSRPLTPAEKKQAQQQGFTLQEIPVALEGVAVVAHPALPLSNVSQRQLRDIYTGRIVNWQELGGPDLPVVAIARDDLGGTVLFFSQAVLNGEALAPNVRRSPNTTEALRLTGNTPGAIYFASAPEVVGQCTVKPLSIDQQPPYEPPYIDLQNCPNQRNQPNLKGFESGDYPLTRKLYVVSNTEQTIGQAYAALLLSQEGQIALNKAGFAQLR